MAICRIEKVIIKLNKVLKIIPRRDGPEASQSRMGSWSKCYAGCQALQQEQLDTVVIPSPQKRCLSEQWGWTSRFIKGKWRPSAEAVLVWHSPPGGMSHPPWESSEPDAALTNRLAGALRSPRTHDHQRCWDGAPASTAEAALRQGQQMQKRPKDACLQKFKSTLESQKDTHRSWKLKI